MSIAGHLGNRAPVRVILLTGLGFLLARVVASRAGHSRPSMSLDVYTHVMPEDQVADDRFLALIAPRARPAMTLEHP
jgi:hypothetical protein